MDFSRGSELTSTQFDSRPSSMEHMKTEPDHKGLDLSNSVLDRLSQKVMR